MNHNPNINMLLLKGKTLMSRNYTILPQRNRDSTHSTIQKNLLSFFPQAQIEYPFPFLHRIADIVLLSHKIVFEIQCSSISLTEVQNRNQDYESIGFKVIWILHHRTFNQNIICPSELYLRQRCLTYFTSITHYGYGFFYDQFELFNGLHRTYKSMPFILKNLLPKHLPYIPYSFPKALKKKLLHTSYYLQGDVSDYLLKGHDSNWMQIIEKIDSPNVFKKSKKLLQDFFLYLLYFHAKSTKQQKID